MHKNKWMPLLIVVGLLLLLTIIFFVATDEYAGVFWARYIWSALLIVVDAAAVFIIYHLRDTGSSIPMGAASLLLYNMAQIQTLVLGHNVKVIVSMSLIELVLIVAFMAAYYSSSRQTSKI